MNNSTHPQDIIFSPAIEPEQAFSYESKDVRSGITPISAVDVLDEPELQKYLIRLKSTSGSPESKDIEDLQKTHLINNAKTGLPQTRLTHRELHHNINKKNHSRHKNNTSSDHGLLKLLVLLIRNVLRIKDSSKKNNSKKHSAIDHMLLAKDWRRDDYPLPPTNSSPKKNERDKFYTFDTLYRQVIMNFIDQVGMLPASESHHHNWPGGLLKHSLEVAEVSLKYSKAWDLSPQGLNDYEAQRRPRWQYASWIIGLLHDVGKSITDMVVICEDADGNSHRWTPTMIGLNQFCKENQIQRYFVDMNPASRYINGPGRFKRHEGMAGSLLHNILTPEAKHFLSSSPDPGFGLMEQVTTILSGKNGEPYLMKALAEGENLSVHLSFKKVRSEFHLDNRNASVPELLMRTLIDMRHKESFLKHVFVISGYVLLRFPESLNMLKQALINASPETKTVMHYGNIEMAKMLRNAGFIRCVSEENYLPRFALTEAVIRNNPKTNSTETVYERNNGFFTVMVLEHSTMLFGSESIPPSVTGVLRLNQEFAIEFLSDNEIFEFVIESNTEEEIDKKRPGLNLDPENKWTVVGRSSETKAENDENNDLGAKANILTDQQREAAKQNPTEAVSITNRPVKKKKAKEISVNSANGHTSPQKEATLSDSPSQSLRKRKPKAETTVVDIFALDQSASIVTDELTADPNLLLADVANVEVIADQNSQLDDVANVEVIADQNSQLDDIVTDTDNQLNDDVYTSVDTVSIYDRLIITFAKFAQISENNLLTLKNQRIPLSLFQAPFFIDERMHYSTDDWAVNGPHIDRRNNRQIVISEIFVKDVLDYLNNDATISNDPINITKDQVVEVPISDLESKTESGHQEDEFNLVVKQTCNALLAWAKDKRPAREKIKSGKVPKANITAFCTSVGLTLDELHSLGIITDIQTRLIILNTELIFSHVSDIDENEKTVNSVDDNQIVESINNDTFAFDPPASEFVTVEYVQISIDIAFDREVVKNALPSNLLGVFMWLYNRIEQGSVISVPTTQFVDKSDYLVKISKDQFHCDCYNAIQSSYLHAADLDVNNANLAIRTLWKQLAGDNDNCQCNYKKLNNSEYI